MTDHREEHDPPIDDIVVNRFVDGDLRSDQRAAFAALLSKDADAVERASEYQRQNILLQALYPSRADDCVLPEAGAELARGLRRGRSFRHAVAACVASVALIGAGVSGWEAQKIVQRAQAPAPVVAVLPPAAPNVAAPVVPTATPDAASSNAAVLETLAPDSASAPRASQVPVHPPNLRAVGYQLVDGRADVTAYGPVIRFSYEPVAGTEGAQLSLAVAAFGDDRENLTTSINPHHTSLFWRGGPLMYALSGNTDAAGLLRVLSAIDGFEAVPATPLEARPAAPGVPAVPQTPGVEPAVETPVDQAPVPVQPAVEVTDRPKDT